MLTGVLFQGDTTAASLFKTCSQHAGDRVSASARPLKRDRCSAVARLDGAGRVTTSQRRLGKSTDFMVLNINVFDDKDTYINRQYYELKNANCNPLTFFKPKMALVASSKNPPAPLVQDYFVCKPSKSAALNIAIGAATGTAGLIGTAALSFMVLVSVFLSKHCSKEKVIMFDDGDIEDELYEMAYDKLLEQKLAADAEEEEEKAAEMEDEKAAEKRASGGKGGSDDHDGDM